MMRSSNRLYKKITFLHELYLFSKKVTLKIKFQSQVLTGRHRLVHWVRFGMLPSYMAWKLGNLVEKSTTTPGSPLPLEFDGPWLLSISISAGNFFSTFEPSPVEVELKPCFPRGNRETDSRSREDLTVSAWRRRTNGVEFSRFLRFEKTQHVLDKKGKKMSAWCMSSAFSLQNSPSWIWVEV